MASMAGFFNLSDIGKQVCEKRGYALPTYRRELKVCSWLPPLPTYIKFNTDGFLAADAKVGVIARNHFLFGTPYGPLQKSLIRLPLV